MQKNEIVTVGTVRRRDGVRWYVEGWHFEGGDFPLQSVDDRVAGWYPQELATIADVRQAFGHDAAVTLAAAHRG